MKMKIGIFLIAIISAALFTGCTTPPSTPTPANATPYPGLKAGIEIKGFAFNPQSITVNKGTNVTWTNKDSVTHDIKSQGIFESPVLQNGESWSYTFNSTGTFDYICGIHPSMKGRITVQ